jgi:hypothetical protein
LAVLGKFDNNDGPKISRANMDFSESYSVMSVLNLTLAPDGIGINLKMVLKRIHGLSPGMILRHPLTGAIAELIPLLGFELC